MGWGKNGCIVVFGGCWGRGKVWGIDCFMLYGSGGRFGGFGDMNGGSDGYGG